MEQELTIPLTNLVSFLMLSFYAGFIVSLSGQALARATWDSKWARRRRLKKNIIEKIEK